MSISKAMIEFEERRLMINDMKEKLTEKKLLLELQYEKTLNELLDYESYKLDNVALIIEMIKILSIENEITNDVYGAYVMMCENAKIEPMTQIAFSRFVVKYFGYKIIDKKINGTKHRVFFKAKIEDDQSLDNEY